ncbi:MAG: hypothetical protein M3155_04675 [Actinomycetota bacterium]|nr:hypothetical protein [Actinomycetota bacterium]
MAYRAVARAHVVIARAAAGVRARLAVGAAGDAGQGTVEYVALILLVAVVLAGVVVATRKTSIGDGGIGRTIVEKIKGALDQVR